MHKLLILCSLLVLTACVSVNETPMTANVWQIEAVGKGAFGKGKTREAVVKRAAELTVQQGFERFMIIDPRTNRATVYAGNSPTSIFFSPAGNSAQITGGAMYMYRETTTVFVRMFREGDPEFANALDAKGVLSTLGGG